MTNCDRCGVVIADNEMYSYAEVSICNSVDNDANHNLAKFPASTGRKLICVSCTSKVMSTNGAQDILPTGDQYKYQVIERTVRED